MAKTENPNKSTPAEHGSLFPDFYRRLNDLGFGSKNTVRQYLLPDWWCDEFEQSPSAMVEASAYVCRRTGIDFAALMAPGQALTLAEGAKLRYKLHQGTEQNTLAIARALGEQVSKLVAYACPKPLLSVVGVPASEIRAEILASARAGDVGITLEGLLTFCWGRGIPVVHLSNLPSGNGKKKFDGMVGEFDGRPVLAIGSGRKSAAWLAFVLAHELGHIAADHVTGGARIIDEKINPEDGENEQELEADRFAVELIYGRAEAAYRFLGKPTPNKLAELAISAGVRDRVNPASVALNYAWLMNQEGEKVWGLATKAIQQLEGSTRSANEIISEYLNNQLNWESLSEDNREFLEHIASIA
jgi:Zn-dependent peptidase ImmA (M78 family)